jgi:SAM-dependent methyltransferase
MQEIIEGVLTCTQCRRQYPIIAGIPRMLPDSLRDALWQYHGEFLKRHPELSVKHVASDEFSEAQRATYSSFSFQRIELTPPNLQFRADWIEHFDRRIRPLHGHDLRGKIGLDVGCGFGRHLYAAHNHGAEMIGIDLSEGIERAYENNLGNPRVHVVQGDIFRMPFRSGAFDFAYSFGVLHHLPDPAEGFQRVSRFVRQGGDLLIWVYGYRGMSWSYRVSHLRALRKVSAKLPRPLQFVLSAIVAFLLEILLWAPSRLANHFAFARNRIRQLPAQVNMNQPFRMKITAVFDRLGAPTTHFHDREELLKWYHEAAFEHVQVFSEDRRGWQGFGRRAGTESLNQDDYSAVTRSVQQHAA